MKKIIYNADDFGISKTANEAITEGLQNGILNSTTVMPNMEAFEDAMENHFPKFSNIPLGVHLNIIEGNWLTDGRFFEDGFIDLLKKSYDKNFKQKIEKEFRLQIEKVLKYTQPTHLDSHVHTHAIPGYFEITCKLAKEYGINYVRTQFEKPYFVPDISKYKSSKYPINLIKVALLNSFTLINKKTIEKYQLETNDYAIGINYTGYMDKNTIEYGIRAIKNENCTIEVIIHPNTDKENKPTNYQEYLAIRGK